MTKFFLYPFGNSGDLTPIPDDAQLDGSESYQEGFTSDYELVYGSDPSAKAIDRSQFNQLMNDVTTNIRQYQTNGIPLFITSSQNGGVPFPYDQYAQVLFDDGSGIQPFVSLVSSNTTDPTNITNWAVLSQDGWMPGDEKCFCGSTIPAGRWLPQDGAIHAIADYPRLFAAIGNLWGGDGVTTFAVPNAARKVSMGSGGASTSIIGNSVSDQGGFETHSLTPAENGPHDHGALFSGDLIVSYRTGGSQSFQLTSGLQHISQIDGSTATASSGSGTPHNIVQPAKIVMFLIRY